jgi:hypothetical protein
LSIFSLFNLPLLNSEMIWEIWKKGKLNCEKIWKIWKKANWIVKRYLIFSLFNLVFLHIFRIFSQFSSRFFHIFHIFSPFNIENMEEGWVEEWKGLDNMEEK